MTRWVAVFAAVLVANFAFGGVMLSLPGQRYAVIVAVDQTLKRDDASAANVESVGKDLAAMLRSNYGYEHIEELYGSNATADYIFRTLTELQYRVRRGDTVLLVVLTDWIVLPSGGTALMPADGDAQQPWTLPKLSDLRAAVSGISAASVVVLLDRCVRDEISSYANQAAQVTKGDTYSYSVSRSPAVIISGCVRGMNERGQFIGRVNGKLREFAGRGPASSAQGLTIKDLLDQVTQVRVYVEIDTQDLGGGPLKFEFRPVGGAIDPTLEASIRNRSGGVDSRLVAMGSLSSIVALEKPDSGIAIAAGALLESLASDRDEDRDVRIAAVQQLGRQHHAHSAQLFTDITGDEAAPPALRGAALEALVLLGREVAHDVVMKALSASNAEVRAAAARQFRAVARPEDTALLLQRLSEEDAEQALITLIQTAATLELSAQQLLPPLHRIIESSSSGDARREAIGALGNFNVEESYAPLAKVLTDESQPPLVRQDAAYAIGKLSFSNPDARAAAARLVAQAATQSDAGVRRGVADTLGRLKVGATRETLETLARDKQYRVREATAIALGQFGDAAAAPMLETLLKDSSAAVRRAAALSLKEFSDTPRYVRALTIAANDKDPSVRQAAAESLKRFESSGDSVDAIVQTVNRIKDPHEKARAIRLLPALDDARVIAALVASLESHDREVTDAAIAKLASIPGVEVTRQLASAVLSKDDETSAAAVVALGRIGEGSQAGSPQWQQALTTLVKMPPDTHVSMRIAAARALGSFADPSALASILQYARDPRGEVALAAADGLRALAASYARAKNIKMAIDAGGRAAELRQRLVGEMNVETATDYNNLGAYFLLGEDLNNAEAYLQRSLAIRERVLGANDLDTAVSLANLGSLYLRMSDVKRAEPLFLRVLSIRERVLAPSDPAVLQTLENLSALYTKIGDAGRAEKYQQRIKYLRQGAKGA